MTVVVVGAGGWIGRQLVAAYPGAHAISASAILADAGASLGALLQGGEAVIVNAAGARRGDEALLTALNADLPSILASRSAESGAHLVHLGSAAEYGIGGTAPLSESDTPRPGTTYGTTKLQGTQAALGAPGATVLRVFNVAAAPPQPGSPLADVVLRARNAVTSGTDATLLAPGSTRDWVSLEFVVRSVLAAVTTRPGGIYNICSGTGVRLGDAVEAVLRMAGSRSGVVGDARHTPDVVIGDHSRWEDATGLRSRLGLGELAAVIWSGIEELNDAGGASGGSPL